jgi:ribosomal protein S18 acetylase RimI-like enzyme
MSGWRVETDVDDSAAYAAFATDRLWCGYAIADLEPPFRAFARVAVAHRGGEVAACLVLRAPAFNAIVPHGPGAGLDAILERISLPRRTHLFALDEHLAPLRRWFVYVDPVPMLRMAVDAASFVGSADVAAVDRLGPGDFAALTELYAPYAESAFQPEQLLGGVFYGIRDGAGLLAAAGTHVVSARYTIAAVGNIYTRPSARGRGLAGAVTSAVVAELLAGGYRDVILNVARDNVSAQYVYTRLGFREHLRHYEGTASLRESHPHPPGPPLPPEGEGGGGYLVFELADAVAEDADGFDLALYDVAVFEPFGWAHAHGDAGGGAGDDHVARLEGRAGREDLENATDVVEHV